jgi:type I restriction enzyme S subunit
MPRQNGWQVHNVEELIRKGILEVGDGYRAKNSEMGQTGLPFLRVANIHKTGFDFTGIDVLDTKNLSRVGNKISETDDIVFTTKGTVGRFAFVKGNTPRFVYSPQISFWRIKDKEILDPRFLLYWLQGPEFSKQVSQVKGLTDMADYVNLRDQRRMRIFAPSLPVQRKIADVLSAYDDLIEVNTRRIRILEQMAQSMYREWFGEVDNGSLPEGWEQKTLSDVADVNSTSITRGNEPAEIRYVDIASVSTGKIDLIQPLKFVDAPGRARRIVQHGDVIWSTVRPNRRSYSLIINPPENMIVSTGFAVLRARTVPFSYLYLATTTDEFAGYLANHATGSAYPAVVGSDFENAKIVLPPKDLLSRFEEVATPMFLLRETLLAKNTILRRTRDLLLPRLVSGEIDVSTLNIKGE